MEPDISTLSFLDPDGKICLLVLEKSDAVALSLEGALSGINLSRFACGGDLVFSPASSMLPIVTLLQFTFCSGMVDFSDNLLEAGVYAVILESSRSTFTSWLSG